MYNVKAHAVAQVESHIRRFKQFFPYFAGHTIYGGIAGFHIPKDVTQLAVEKGFLYSSAVVTHLLWMLRICRCFDSDVAVWGGLLFSHRVLKMTDQELKNLVASLPVAQDKTAALLASMIQRSDRELASLSQNLKDTRGEVAGVGNSQGLVAEEFFYNSLLDKPTIGGVKYDQVHANLNAGKRSNYFECDIAMINGKSAALLEVKYNVKAEAVEQLENNIRRFKQFFPVFAQHTIYGGIAGFHIPKEVSKLALEKGFFVLKRRGDAFTVDAKNMQGF